MPMPTPIIRRGRRGKQFLECEVVLQASGVLNVSNVGRVLHTPEECRAWKAVEGWAGKRVVVNHPSAIGCVSALDKGVWQRSGVGLVVGPRWDQERSAVLGTAMLDIARVLFVDQGLPQGQRIMERLLRGQRLEVSAGIYWDHEPISGVHNGLVYNSVSRNHLPDHLAILPCDIGACPVSAGGGMWLRVE